ncbi:nicotinate-nucleotide adenylyltransferase, partial [Enterococcus faecalis]|nr:nicotinate-nucleotide adenylyltransferase [Enterococcus faecalis]
MQKRKGEQMKSEMEKQAINLLVEAMNDDSLIIFVGAGVSANSGLPGWNQLVDVFRDELALDDDADNLKVAQFYYDTWGQQKYFQKISDIFNEHLNAQPNEIHKHIFRIQPRHLITTNYDTILENKMNSEMDKYDVLKQDKDIPYSKSSRYLIKMHGDLLTKNIVLKENDYL